MFQSTLKVSLLYEVLAKLYLKLGEVSVENQDYGRAQRDFRACLDIKKFLLLADSRYRLPPCTWPV